MIEAMYIKRKEIVIIQHNEPIMIVHYTTVSRDDKILFLEEDDEYYSELCVIKNNARMLVYVTTEKYDFKCDYLVSQNNTFQVVNADNMPSFIKALESDDDDLILVYDLNNLAVFVRESAKDSIAYLAFFDSMHNDIREQQIIGSLLGRIIKIYKSSMYLKNINPTLRPSDYEHDYEHNDIIQYYDPKSHVIATMRTKDNIPEKCLIRYAKLIELYSIEDNRTFINC